MKIEAQRTSDPYFTYFTHLLRFALGPAFG